MPNFPISHGPGQEPEIIPSKPTSMEPIKAAPAAKSYPGNSAQMEAFSLKERPIGDANLTMKKCRFDQPYNRNEEAAINDKYLRKIIRTLKKSASKHRGDIRPGKRRFGLYRYLRDVYDLYLELRSRRIARKATRRIAEISKLSIKRKSHPLRVLIEASAGPEDARQKSRWTQALKYAYGWRQSAERLEWFFQTNGGISGGARKYALNKKPARRKIVAARIM